MAGLAENRRRSWPHEQPSHMTTPKPSARRSAESVSVSFFAYFIGQYIRAALAFWELWN
jgi:hypothetical protein